MIASSDVSGAVAILTEAALANSWRVAHHVRMKNRLLAIVLFLPLLGGCVDADIVVHFQDDGSGSFDIDIGYDQRAWPSFFGDPFSGWTKRRQLLAFSDPGLGPWAPPQVEVVDGFRHFRSEVFFSDINRVQILGWEDGRPFQALGFTYDEDRASVRMVLGIMDELRKPLPLPTPQQAGMEISISDALMAAIRQEIRPVIEGARLRLAVELPGEVLRADAFDDWKANQAWIEADADRVALAMRERAGQLLNEGSLGNGVLEVDWVKGSTSAAELLEYRRRLEAARQWWGADNP